MSARNRARGGFTLVELLVVVAIIGTLMALLIPAVIGSREPARRIKCTNHQKELALAITQYETGKDYYPGYLNLVKSNTTSWVVPIFQHLGRQDLWEAFRDGDAATVQAAQRVRVDQLVCPSDFDNTNTPPLSYVVNLNVFRDLTKSATRKVSQSDISSASRLPLLSERIDLSKPPYSYTYLDAAGGQQPLKTGPWGPYDTTMAVTLGQSGPLGFAWPVNATSLTATGSLTNLPLRSSHPGGVNVTFCDGHTDFVVDDTLCAEYVAFPNQ